MSLDGFIAIFSNFWWKIDTEQSMIWIFYGSEYLTLGIFIRDNRYLICNISPEKYNNFLVINVVFKRSRSILQKEEKLTLKVVFSSKLLIHCIGQAAKLACFNRHAKRNRKVSSEQNQTNSMSILPHNHVFTMFLTNISLKRSINSQ